MSSTGVQGVHLEWPMDRTERPFAVRVVEPNTYCPSQHAGVFNAVITHLLGHEGRELTQFDDVPTGPAESFDLITFPEAFVPASTFLNALSALGNAGSTGCIHIGLRPNDGDGTHLFSTQETAQLLAGVKELDSVESSDLEAFSIWLTAQKPDGHFNLGCIFAVDAQGRLRVCLHPKSVRSQFEVHRLPENHMCEADLLCLITLRPSSKALKSVTLQPLICSDMLHLPRDNGGPPPIQGINQYYDKFSGDVPDHVDIVTVAACTPQPEASLRREKYRQWHGKFLEAFAETQGGSLPRHNHSAIILSNFRTLKRGAPGGLSGVFLPVVTRSDGLPRDVQVSHYGKMPKRDLNNSWSVPGVSAPKRSNLGSIASLRPFSEPQNCPARLFSFNIQRLPRDNAVWGTPEGLALCKVLVAKVDSQNNIFFEDGAQNEP